MLMLSLSNRIYRGGGQPRPGEVSLAHHGVLFLDELTEFPRKVLDVLREPLEAGNVMISRAARQATFPANFQLIAALNPSPSGDLHDGRHNPEQILRYLNRLSGPFLERIDLQIDVAKIDSGELHLLHKRNKTMSSEKLRERVIKTRERQLRRCGKLNAKLNHHELTNSCKMTNDLLLFLEQAMEKLNLSMRSFHRLLRVARTIADLDDSDVIKREHLAEALGYRALEKLIAQLSH